MLALSVWFYSYCMVSLHMQLLVFAMNLDELHVVFAYLGFNFVAVVINSLHFVTLSEVLVVAVDVWVCCHHIYWFKFSRSM